MRKKTGSLATLPKRLKEARVRCGLSQRELGIKAGLDPFVSSARINRYERGVHQPDPVTVQRLADALGVPVAYLFATNDRLARMILAFEAMSPAAQKQLLAEIDMHTPAAATAKHCRRQKTHRKTRSSA